MSKEKSQNKASKDENAEQLVQLLEKGTSLEDFISFCKTHHYKITIKAYRDSYRILALHKDEEIKINLGNSVEQTFRKYLLKIDNQEKFNNALQRLNEEEEIKTQAVQKFIQFIKLNKDRLMIKAFKKAHRPGFVFSLYLKKKK